MSIGGDYTRIDTGGFDFGVFSVGLAFYLGTPGDGTLVSNHRNTGVYLSRGTNVAF